jgi:adenylylsulfate kinase
MLSRTSSSLSKNLLLRPNYYYNNGSIVSLLSSNATTTTTTKVIESTQKGHQDVTTNIKAKHNENVIWSDALLTKEERLKLLKAKNIGATLWITGLSGSGKSTIGSALEKKLLEMGINAYRLDGDNIRFGLNAGLGFSAQDREENLRRIGEVSALFADAGVVAITTFISPYRASRDKAREIHKKRGLPFYEVYAEVPLEVAESRDPKGLYKKARSGQLKGFTGIDDPYEQPLNPDIVLPTHQLSVEQSCQRMIQILKDKGVIKN